MEPWQPTDKELQQIETMAGYGIKMKSIAAILNMDRGTLLNAMTRHASVESAIEKGRAKTAGQVTRTAFEMAVSGKHPIMTIFWLKCRQNWSELGDFEEIKEQSYGDI